MLNGTLTHVHRYTHKCAAVHVPARGESRHQDRVTGSTVAATNNYRRSHATRPNLERASGPPRIAHDHFHWGLGCNCWMVPNLAIIFGTKVAASVRLGISTRVLLLPPPAGSTLLLQ